MEIAFASCIKTPESTVDGINNMTPTEIHLLTQINNLSKTARKGLFRRSQGVRYNVMYNNGGQPIVERKRKRETKMSECDQKKLYKWVESHPLVKDSPSKDVLNLKIGWSEEKQKVARKIRM